VSDSAAAGTTSTDNSAEMAALNKELYEKQKVNRTTLTALSPSSPPLRHLAPRPSQQPSGIVGIASKGLPRAGGDRVPGIIGI
jgi:hypothetical protein